MNLYVVMMNLMKTVSFASKRSRIETCLGPTEYCSYIALLQTILKLNFFSSSLLVQTFWNWPDC